MQMNWPYIAGFFDGEGCVYIGQSKSRKNYVHNSLSAGQSGELGHSLLLLIQTFLREYGIESKIGKHPPRKTELVKGAFKDMYYIRMDRRQDIHGFLTYTLPFLYIKAEKAKLVKDTLDKYYQDLKQVQRDQLSLRDLVQADYSTGMNYKEIAAKHEIAHATARRYNLNLVTPYKTLAGGRRIKDKQSHE